MNCRSSFTAAPLHLPHTLLHTGGGSDLLSECKLSTFPATRHLPPASFDVPVPRDDSEQFKALQAALDAAEVRRSVTGPQLSTADSSPLLHAI